MCEASRERSIENAIRFWSGGRLLHLNRPDTIELVRGKAHRVALPLAGSVAHRRSAGARASPRVLPVRRWTSGCPVSCPGSSCSSSAERAHADPSITLLIGPEGGFAAEEASAAERAGYRALRLGPAGPAHRDRGGRGPERPAGAVGRSRLGASRTAGASISCSDSTGLTGRTPPRDPTAPSVIFG